MDQLATIRRRHASQRLAGEPLASVVDAVRWSGAVQAQEFAEVKWSLAERVAGAPTDAEVERAFTDGEIIRTHVMRPTWHFVAAEDLRWLLRLTAPRVLATTRSYFTKLELDSPALTRIHRTFAKELAGGEPRTRKELTAALRRDGTDGDSIRFGFVFMHAELEQLICNGPRRGKQHTYLLFDDRVPDVQGPSGDDALAELATRYFRSHGPATARDFSWWSGLTMGQAREAIGLLGSALEEEIDADGTPWLSFGAAEAKARSRAHLVPTYDELIVSYKDLRVDLVAQPPREGLLTRTVAIDGRTVGGWKRTLAANSVTVEVTAFARLGRQEQAELEGTVARFGEFLGLDAELELQRA